MRILRLEPEWQTGSALAEESCALAPLSIEMDVPGMHSLYLFLKIISSYAVLRLKCFIECCESGCEGVSGNRLVDFNVCLYTRATIWTWADMHMQVRHK